MLVLKTLDETTLLDLIVRHLSSKCKCTVSSFRLFSGPAAAEWHLCPTRGVWLHPPAASNSGTTTCTCRCPPGGRSHHRLQQLVTSRVFFQDIFSLIVAYTPQVTSCYCLFCSAAFAMMELCSVTQESVKVRVQSGESHAKTFRSDYPVVRFTCFVLPPSSSHPQRVVRVDALFSLPTLSLGRS